MMIPRLEDGELLLFSHWSSYKTHHHYVFSLSFCLVHLVCTFSRLAGLRLSALGEGRCEGTALLGWDGTASVQEEPVLPWQKTCRTTAGSDEGWCQWDKSLLCSKGWWKT